ncbi:hypothetical protein KCX83_13265 [Brucella oryzae]|uniref:DUF6950 family protein n=1 Tax=Brucella oryzae TaxID=335286 RepID=UPI001B83823F|nr:hypothetical protein [Brucella oryzae]MBR7653291.1 hypothetical protein [Brucella oryzae]
MEIIEFLSTEAQKPFRWGVSDCVSTTDRWIRLCTGLSPLAWVKRDYVSADEAERILADRGGLAVLVNRAMRGVGIAKTDDPQTGDVGLIIHNGKLCMAVHTGDCWFSHDEHGFIGAPLNAVWKAWRIQCQ